MTPGDLAELQEAVTRWQTRRRALAAREAAGRRVAPRRWRRSSADAVAIVHDLADLLGVGVTETEESA